MDFLTDIQRAAVLRCLRAARQAAADATQDVDDNRLYHAWALAKSGLAALARAEHVLRGKGAGP
jgi:uncharacterized membrane protein